MVLVCSWIVCGAYGCSNDSDSGKGNSDACNCTGNQICQNGVCVDPGTSDQGECTDPNGCEKPDPECTDPNGCEKPDPECTDPNGCEKPDPECTDPNGCSSDDPGDTCPDTCIAPDYCSEGTCQTCIRPCGALCCSDEQVCDELNQICVDRCEDGREPCLGSCCADNEVCGEFGCHEKVICTSAQTECYHPEYTSQMVCCNNEAEACDTETGQCVEICRSNIMCGDVCCDEGMECDTFDNKCKPVCAGTRCGEKHDICCDGTAEICLYQQCLPRGADCTKGDDCDFDEYCETTTNTCVNESYNPVSCTVLPVAGEFEPIVKWHWPESLPNHAPTLFPEWVQVMSNPSVINLTDDDGDGKIDENDIPEVIFTSYASSWGGVQALRILNGKDGSEVATYPETVINYQRTNPGIAKINHDEYPEIVVHATIDGNAYTLILNLVPNEDGTGYVFKEVGRVSGSSTFTRIANMDGGEFPQIITSAGIIEYTEDASGIGTYQWRCKKGFGDGHDGYTVADLDGDGEMEVVGSAIYDKNCEVVSNETIAGVGTVLADLDSSDDHADGRLDVEQISYTSGSVPGTGSSDDPSPAIGKVHAFKVYKRDGKFYREPLWITDMPQDFAYAESHFTQDWMKYEDGTPFKCDRIYNKTWKYPGNSNEPEYREWYRRYTCMTGGGPLIVADFDGDHHPDLAQATKWNYVVYKANGEVLWADFNTQDASSAATGSSIFDFEGDGVAEVLYADETKVHIYKGSGSGEIDSHGYCSAVHLIPPIPQSSGTIIEYPIVVDVDNDNQSDILVVSNGSIKGVRVFSDPDGHWVRTRRIWNQYDYHVTNINEDGTVPKHEKQNWKVKNLNNFRQNVQPGGLFNAPNLVASALSSDQSKCSLKPKLLTLVAMVENQGSLGVKAGVSVNFYAANANGTGKKAFLGTATVPTMLLPGGSGSAKLDWDMTGIIDGESTPSKIQVPADIYFVVDEPTAEKLLGEFIECIENDNTLADAKVDGCPEDIN